MFAVIHVPNFALQAALRHEPELWPRPVALLDPAHTTPRIIQVTESARTAGVTEGQTAVQALARCRDITIRHRSSKQEAAAMDAILQVAGSFSPNLERTGPGTVTLDLRGLAELRLATDELPPNPALVAWARRLHTSLSTLNLTSRVGTGPTPNVARHAARWSQSIEVVTDAPAFIASLPVAALEPSEHVADVLRHWDIHTVGELLALGQGELAERFGLEAFALFAAASTGAARPLNLVKPVEHFDESFEFDPPVETLEPLLFLLRRFCDQLSPRLEAFGFVAETLRLTLQLESGAVHERRLRVPQPTRNAEVLFRMLHTHLESVRTNAPIEAVALTAEPTRPQQKQFSLFEAAIRDPHQFQETLARLSALVGADRVGTPVQENTHRPDAFKLVPPDFDNAPSPLTIRFPELLRPVPLRRLRPAVPALVELGDESRPVGPAARKLNSPHTPAANLVAFSQPTKPSDGTSDSSTCRSHTPTGCSGEQPPPNSMAALLQQSQSPSDCSFISNIRMRPSSVSTTESVPKTLLRPVALRCSVASGQITLAIGPWRASGNWWETSAWEREEWDIQTHHQQAVRLVCRNGEWFVEGLAD